MQPVGGAFVFYIGRTGWCLIEKWLGHNLDRRPLDWEAERLAMSRRVTAFCRQPSGYGHLVKADGSVSHGEIDLAGGGDAARWIRHRYAAAQPRLFNQASATLFPLEEVVEQFRRRMPQAQHADSDVHRDSTAGSLCRRKNRARPKSGCCRICAQPPIPESLFHRLRR